MKIKNPVIKFMLHFFVIFILLILPWPGLEGAYGRFFRAEGQWASGILGSQAIVQFSASKEGFDTQINIANRKKIRPDGMAESAHLKIDSRSMGYLSLSLLLALILATPLPWKKRGWALGLGFLLINIFVCLKIILMILQQYNKESWLELFVLSPFWAEKLNFLVYFLVESGETSLLVALIIWLLVCFGKDDWKVLLTQEGKRKGRKTISS